MIRPHGIIPAMITPMKVDQSVNEQALEQLVHQLLDGGAHGLFCLGTNGEFYSLSAEEKIRIAQITVKEAAGKVPVYAGSGGISTYEVIELSKRLEQVGVSTLSVITPYFNAFSQSEIIKHYETLASSVSLPILLYNIPSRTGNSLEPGTVAILSKIPGIVGIKDSSGSFENILKCIEVTDSDFAVMAGTDSLIFWTLMAGGTGAIAATANLYPKLVVSIYESWKSGDYNKANDAQTRLRGIRSMMQMATLPSVLKESMNIRGFPAGPSRLPVQPISEQIRKELVKVMEQYMDSPDETYGTIK